LFVELIEFLRCPRPHEPSALVASASRVVDRHIMDGVLGCPSCGAEFAITDGVAIFDPTVSRAPSTPPSDDDATRVAAFLELSDKRGFALLCGRWGAHAERLRQVTETPLLLVNPPEHAPLDVASGVIVAGDVLPLAPGVARALAIDAGMSDGLVASAARAVRAGGRVLGPVTVTVPAFVTEIARDEHDWVGERDPDTHASFVPLTRAKS
jgi:uncharacterized protein YbaR (Trm112 family)